MMWFEAFGELGTFLVGLAAVSGLGLFKKTPVFRGQRSQGNKSLKLNKELDRKIVFFDGDKKQVGTK